MWKTLKEYSNYAISSTGNVKNTNTDRVLVSTVNRYGYLQIGLRQKGVREKKFFLIHRLVALYFIDSVPDNFDNLEVDHIDHNKTNNNIENLRLVTKVENCLSREFKPWTTNKTTKELYITKYKNGYMIRINRSDYKKKKWLSSLDEAIKVRDEYIEEINAIRK